MHKPLVTIENWAVVQRALAMSALSYEELQPGRHLMGKVVGHTSLSTAECVYTSPIVRVDASKRRVETRNTVYQLGKPSDGYTSWEQQKQHAAA
jgi:hypothetical protein